LYAEDLKSYETLKSSIPCPQITVKILWIEDLGVLLAGLGSEGREKITSLEFEWDTTRRPEGIECSPPGVSDRWYGDRGVARALRLLGECGSLKKVKIVIDAFALTHRDALMRPTEIKTLESYRALREVRLGRDAEVELCYHNSGWFTAPGGLKEGLKEGMLRPREEEEVSRELELRDTDELLPLEEDDHESEDHSTLTPVRSFSTM
jgi:hypothetical protein